MTLISLTRGSTDTRELRLYITELADLPANFSVVFAVKKVLDSDITDALAIIKKTLAFPADFNLVEPAEADNYYKANLVLTYEDTTKSQGEYSWNVRLITTDKTFIKDTSIGTFKITLTPTQTQ